MRSMAMMTRLLFASAWMSACSNGSSITTNGAENAPAETNVANVANDDADPLYAVPIDGLPTMGERDALVTLVELTDYDCPFCGKAEHTVLALRKKYGRDLRVSVAEHPLPMHPHARDAALAALAANDANDARFEAMHTRLFENPDARSPDELVRIADESGIARSAFARSTASGTPSASLATAEALGTALHVRGTPTFFVNGHKIGGAQPLETFDVLVARELAHARALVASGVSSDRVYATIVDAARANPVTFKDDDEAESRVIVPAARDVTGADFLGRSDAKTTLVLFTDFECPYCKKLDAKLRELVLSHPDVRVVLRNRPLAMHPHARLAAKAAVAASAQGKLDFYAKVLFDHQDALDRASLVRYASLASLDVGRFTRDLDSAQTEARVASDEALGTKLGVKGTPTSFIDGRQIVGAQPIQTFESALPQ